MKQLKYAGMVLIAIWFIGAALMTIVYEYERKADCINNEGFFKGLLWCETSATSRTEFSVNHTSSFIRGLGWPVHLFNGNSKQDI